MKKNKFDTLMSASALIVSIFSLVVTWSASQKQYNPNVAIVASEGTRVAIRETNVPILLCSNRIIISNLGGADTAIIDFDVEVKFLDAQIRFGSNKYNSVWEQRKILWNSFSNFMVTLVNRDYLHNIEKDISEYELDYPFQLPAYKTEEIFAYIRFASSEEMIERNAYLSDLYSDETIKPIEITYYFELANGDTVVSPPIPCAWISTKGLTN